MPDVVNSDRGRSMEALAAHARVIEARIFRPGARLAALHSDSRRAAPDTAFFALRGLRTDGHRFVDAALAAGTPALFVSDPEVYARLAGAPNPPTSELEAVFRVEPGREALAELAGEVSGWPDRFLTLLAVTGTNGKTTVTHLIAQLMAALGRDCAVVGTRGLRVGRREMPLGNTTPEAPDLHAFFRQCLDGNTATVAMEASSHGLALQRTRGLRFAAAGFTNLTRDHLDFHGTMDEYRDAKFGLFLAHDVGRCVVNLDDPAGRDLAGRLAGLAAPHVPPPLTVALDHPADLALADVRHDGAGLHGTLVARTNGVADPIRAPFRLPMLGGFNLSNFLVAAGMLLAAGYDGAGGLPAGVGPAELAAAAAGCPGAPGRFERVPLDAPFTVVVDYAHTPDALENLLATARNLADERQGRLLVAFGAGGERDRAKRPLMGAAGERWADAIILTNDNPRSEHPEAILAEIRTGLAGRVPAQTIADRREAIAELLAQARPGDMVVIAGKGDEPYQDIAGTKHPFDDRQVAREWAADQGIALQD